MNWKILLFILIVILMFGGLSAKQDKLPSEKKFRKELCLNWKYDDTKGYYVSNEKFMFKLLPDSTYHLVLLSKDTSLITKYFGRHFSIINFRSAKDGSYADVMEYKLSRPCEGPSHCTSLLFAFRYGKVINIQYKDVYEVGID